MRCVLLTLAVLAAAAGPAPGQDFELEFSEDTLNALMRRLGDPSDGGVYYPTPGEGAGLFDDCVPFGFLECARAATGAAAAAVATAAPSAGAAAPPPAVDYDPEARIPLSRCRRPDGRVLVVPGREAVVWQWWVTGARFNVVEGRLELSATVRARVGGRWTVEPRTVPATFEVDPGTQRLRLRTAAFRVPVQYEADGEVRAITHVDVSRLLSFAVPITAQALRVPRLDGSPRTINTRVQSGNVEYLTGKVRVRVDANFY